MNPPPVLNLSTPFLVGHANYGTTKHSKIIPGKRLLIGNQQHITFGRPSHYPPSPLKLQHWRHWCPSVSLLNAASLKEGWPRDVRKTGKQKNKQAPLLPLPALISQPSLSP